MKTQSEKYTVKTLDAFCAGSDGRDDEGFSSFEPTSWKEAKAAFWRIAQNNRNSFQKGQSWEKGVGIYAADGTEIIAETTENLGSVAYSEIVKP